MSSYHRKLTSNFRKILNTSWLFLYLLSNFKYREFVDVAMLMRKSTYLRWCEDIPQAIAGQDEVLLLSCERNPGDVSITGDKGFEWGITCNVAQMY